MTLRVLDIHNTENPTVYNFNLVPGIDCAISENATGSILDIMGHAYKLPISADDFFKKLQPVLIRPVTDLGSAGGRLYILSSTLKGAICDGLKTDSDQATYLPDFDHSVGGACTALMSICALKDNNPNFRTRFNGILDQLDVYQILGDAQKASQPLDPNTSILLLNKYSTALIEARRKPGLNIDPVESSLSGDKKFPPILLLHIMEIVRNASKEQINAKKIHVSLNKDNDKIRVAISDDGVCFDQKKLENLNVSGVSATESTGLGFNQLFHYFSIINGGIEITTTNSKATYNITNQVDKGTAMATRLTQSSPFVGTTYTLTIPCSSLQT